MYGNPYYQPYDSYNDYLEHHGVKGMKWGIRRYQNADGTLTKAGKKRKAKMVSRLTRYNERVTDSRRKAQRHERIRDNALISAQIAEGLGIMSYQLSTDAWDADTLANAFWKDAIRYTKKGDHLISQMKKKFGNDIFNDVDPKVVNKGRDVVYQVVLDNGKKMILARDD